MTTRQLATLHHIHISRVRAILYRDKSIGTPPGEGRRDWDVDPVKFEKALNRHGREAGRPKGVDIIKVVAALRGSIVQISDNSRWKYHPVTCTAGCFPFIRYSDKTDYVNERDGSITFSDRSRSERVLELAMHEVEWYFETGRVVSKEGTPIESPFPKKAGRPKEKI